MPFISILSQVIHLIALAKVYAWFHEYQPTHQEISSQDELSLMNNDYDLRFFLIIVMVSRRKFSGRQIFAESKFCREATY